MPAVFDSIMKRNLGSVFFIVVIYIGFGQSSNISSNSIEDWSNWSEWSKCSRTCGTGLAVQSRRCRNWQGCKGNSVRYRVCIQKECLSGLDFYASQCSDFNTDGKKWEPDRSENSCELRCKLSDGNNKEGVKLGERVLDGTHCANFSRICVHGQCQEIGCDLILESGKKTDACGVCGGNESSCTIPNPRWIRHVDKECTATCGGGYQVLSSLCEDTTTRKKMKASACSAVPKPSPTIISCANIPCPATWKTESWSECSSTCGSGYQLREVYCSQSRNNSNFKVADHTCQDHRPIHWRSCERKCPTWSVGSWNVCSVSCGDGVKSRDVQCRYIDGSLGSECDISKRPNATRPCRTWIPCEPTIPPKTTVNDENESIFVSGEVLHMEKDPVPAEPTFISSDWSSCSTTCGEGVKTRSVKCKIFLEFSRTIPVLPDSQCPGQQPVDSKKCNLAPCNYGFDKRAQQTSTEEDYLLNFSSMEASDPVSDGFSSENEIKIDTKQFSKFSNKISKEDIESKLPEQSKLMSFQDTVADGIIVYSTPNSEELFSSHGHNYIAKDFIHNKLTMNSPYYWKAAGFTTCSRTCLGGEQESIYHCIRGSDQKQVSSFFCDINERPDALTRTCNDHPCPPRWEPMEYGPCSKSCDGGIKKRKFHCLHEITRSGSGRMVVPDYHCTKPPPKSQIPCNINGCPRWNAGKWTKCSIGCGGGFRMRTVLCIRDVLKSDFGESKKEELPETECKERKPSIKRHCKQRRCKQNSKSKRRKPLIRTDTSQDYKQRVYKKTVTLKIGGRAKVFHGANVKIRCPAKYFEKRRIKWFKNDSRLRKRIGHIRITRKGAIKIHRIQYTDKGIYICKANEESANLTLIVQPIPSSYGSLEESNAILSNKVDTKIEAKPEMEDYEARVKIAGKYLAEKNDFSRRKLPENSNTILYSEHSQRNKVGSKGEHGSSDVKKSFRKVVYGQVNHHHNDWSRIALPKTGISLLSATLGQSNPMNWTNFNDSSQPGNSHVYGTVKNQPNNQHDVKIRHGYKPVVGRVSEKTSTIDSNNKYDINMIYERQTSQEDPSDHRVRSTGSVNFFSNKLESLTTGDTFWDQNPNNFDNGSHEILGTGTRESLEFEWKVTNWTACSQSCSFTGNSGGYQVRSTQCVLRVENVIRSVDSVLCLDAGLAAPPTIQKCGFEECPRWQVEDWSDCEKSNCFTLHYARQTRDISCIFHNGSEATFNHCDDVTKPHWEKDCYNRLCIGVWKTGNWTKCIAPCGGQGYKTRLLKCVWNGTDKAGGNACRELARPEVVRWCDGPSCHVKKDRRNRNHTNGSGSKCEDHSKYCKIVVRIDMCKHYKDLCCFSCQ